MRKAVLALAVLLMASTFKTSTIGLAQETPLLAGKPALSKTHIVFAYAGDLWVVSRDGGQANPPVQLGEERAARRQGCDALPPFPRAGPVASQQA